MRELLNAMEGALGVFFYSLQGKGVEVEFFQSQRAARERV